MDVRLFATLLMLRQGPFFVLESADLSRLPFKTTHNASPRRSSLGFFKATQTL
jgi:hypothetical protein